jgi:hypothetical protein
MVKHPLAANVTAPARIPEYDRKTAIPILAVCGNDIERVSTIRPRVGQRLYLGNADVLRRLIAGNAAHIQRQ